jgi:hypothetical protein
MEPLEGRILLSGESGNFVTLTLQGQPFSRPAYITYAGRTFLATVGAADFLVSGQAGSYGGLGEEVLAASVGSVTRGFPVGLLPCAKAGAAAPMQVIGLVDAPSLADTQRADDLWRLLAAHAADAAQSADASAAFGAAVWEIAHETRTRLVNGQPVPDYNLRTGEFRLSPSGGGRWDRLADEWLADLGAAVHDGFGVVMGTAQDATWIVPRDSVFPGPADYSPAEETTAIVRAVGDHAVLVVRGTGLDDALTISQSGGTITVVSAAGSQDFTGVRDGVAVYGFGGADSIRLAHSLSLEARVYAGDGADQVYDNSTGADYVWAGAGDDLLVSVGGSGDRLYGEAGLDGFWLDSQDLAADADSAETAAGAVHAISQFAQPTSDPASRPAIEIAGQDLIDPAAAYPYTNDFISQPLWLDGPDYNDIAQGLLGDCYFLAGISALAGPDAQRLRQAVTALGDGTYAVRFYDLSADVSYYRVDGQLPTSGSQPAYAKLTPDGELWVAILEKAFFQFRFTGANSYVYGSGGWPYEPFRAITGLSTQNDYPSNYTASALAQKIATELAAGHAVAGGTKSVGLPAYLVGGHTYAVQSVAQEAGVWYVTVYNPWGYDGSASYDSNPADGLLKLTADVFKSCFSLVTTSLS